MYVIRRQNILHLFYISLLLMSSLAFSDDDWKKLGSTMARPTSETVTIPVTPSLQEYPFKAMRFRVHNGDIKIQYAKLILQDGDAVRLNLQKRVLSGHSSRVLPLEINGRGIRKIIVHYLLEQKGQVRLDVLAQ